MGCPHLFRAVYPSCTNKKTNIDVEKQPLIYIYIIILDVENQPLIYIYNIHIKYYYVYNFPRETAGVPHPLYVYPGVATRKKTSAQHFGHLDFRFLMNFQPRQYIYIIIMMIIIYICIYNI